MPLMTGEEYAAFAEGLQAAIVAAIKAEAPTALVLDRDPVNIDEGLWAGALRSPDDVVDGRSRIHAWVTTFAASDDLASSHVRTIAPTFRFRVQVFYEQDFGTEADNSEKRIRAEVLKVQVGIAKAPKLVNATRHKQLPVRIKLGRLSNEVIHRGEGELSVEIDPITVR